MTFFYDLNKKIAALAGTQLNEGKNAKPDFLDIDKDGNKKESMKKAVADKEQQVDEAGYSAKAARAGKDIGKPGKAFGKIAADAAKRYGSKEKGEKVAGAVLAKLRAKESVEPDMEEGNAFTAKLKSTPKGGKFKLGDKEFTDTSTLEEKKEKPKAKNAFDPEVARSMFAGDKDKTKTGHEVKDTGYSKRYTKKLDDEPETDDEVSNEPKKKGRKTVGAGKGKKIGAKHSGTSKLHRKDAIAECGDEDMTISLLDKGEYDREGDMAKKDLKSIAMAAKELHAILGDDQNLPEWVQSKITKALDYINSSNQYMHQEQGDEVVAEKAVSQQQQKFMGMAHAMQKGEKVKGASPELKKVAKTMKKSDVKDFASTKHKGLPKKVKDSESVKEEDAQDSAPKSKKGGIQFGQGVYEAMDHELEKVISESMNINVSVNQNEMGEPTKSITVSAEGDDAEVLAQLLNLAGLQGKQEQVDEVDENQPDWPTDEVEGGKNDPQLKLYAGGLNKPKETGQTTAPVVNRDPARGSIGPKEMAEATDLGLNLYAELKSFKAK